MPVRSAKRCKACVAYTLFSYWGDMVHWEHIEDGIYPTSVGALEIVRRITAFEHVGNGKSK